MSRTSTIKSRTRVAVIGSGNIGTDLMVKILRLSESLETTAMAGIDPDSDGLARTRRLKVATTHAGVDGLPAIPRPSRAGYYRGLNGGRRRVKAVDRYSWSSLQGHGWSVSQPDGSGCGTVADAAASGIGKGHERLSLMADL